MGLDSESYDGRQRLEICTVHLVGMLIYMDDFEPLVSKGHQSFCLINKCTKNVRLQCNLFEFKDCYCVLIQRNYFSLIAKAAMVSEKTPVLFSNERNTFGIFLFPECSCNPFLKTEIFILQYNFFKFLLKICSRLEIHIFCCTTLKKIM